MFSYIVWFHSLLKLAPLHWGLWAAINVIPVLCSIYVTGARCDSWRGQCLWSFLTNCKVKLKGKVYPHPNFYHLCEMVNFRHRFPPWCLFSKFNMLYVYDMVSEKMWWCKSWIRKDGGRRSHVVFYETLHEAPQWEWLALKFNSRIFRIRVVTWIAVWIYILWRQSIFEEETWMWVGFFF
jgi:hypothetical protein